MASLIDTFRALFPDRPKDEVFNDPPVLPADIFAFAGYVLEQSGAYHHITPSTGSSKDGRQIFVRAALRKRAEAVGKAWRNARAPRGKFPRVRPRVIDLWKSLNRFSDAEVLISLSPTDLAPKWWIIALELLMIADEASRRLGFDPTMTFFEPIALFYAERDVVSGDQFRRIQGAPSSLSTASGSLVCVQPKSRTPSVGCTLRSLTHHLALLPGQGEVRARWIAPLLTKKSKPPNSDLGLLLIPFPYRIGDTAFRRGNVLRSGDWGWFDVDQRWLPELADKVKRAEFVEFVVGLIKAARQSGHKVDGVVLPELALDYALYFQLALALARDNAIDFLISGISEDGAGRAGNFAAIAPFYLLGKRSESIAGLHQSFLIREKHHRWKLTPSQLKDYGLKRSLKSKTNWWEKLSLLERSLDILVYRKKTTLTTLICEDLARVDPCQAILRSIGPNLVIALLMDGPQLATRWPARYATVLAEDPGSSVLTFTSLGLIERQNALGTYKLQSSIGLWKDEKTGVTELELPRGAEALFLKLGSSGKTERALDGRTDRGLAQIWKFKSCFGVSAASRPAWIGAGSGR